MQTTAADIRPGNITDIGGTPFIVTKITPYDTCVRFDGHTAAYGIDIPWTVLCYSLDEPCGVVMGRWE